MPPRASGQKSDPLVIDSSDEDNRAGPSHRPAPTSATQTRTQASRLGVVDLTLSDSSDDRTSRLPAPPRRQSSSPSKRRRCRISLGDLSDHIDIGSDSSDAAPGPSIRPLKRERASQAQAGTWLNPTAIGPTPRAASAGGNGDGSGSGSVLSGGVGTWANPREIGPATVPRPPLGVQSSPKGTWANPRDIGPAPVLPPVPQVPPDIEGSWANPREIGFNPGPVRPMTPDVPVALEGSWANPREIGPSSIPVRLSTPDVPVATEGDWAISHEIVPHPPSDQRQSSAAAIGHSTDEGTWSNPRTIGPTISHLQPASIRAEAPIAGPSGTWLHPVEIVSLSSTATASSSKRVASPGAHTSDESNDGRRKGKVRRVNSPSPSRTDTNMPTAVDHSVPSKTDVASTAGPVRLGPRWATDDELAQAGVTKRIDVATAPNMEAASPVVPNVSDAAIPSYALTASNPLSDAGTGTAPGNGVPPYHVAVPAFGGGDVVIADSRNAEFEFLNFGTESGNTGASDGIRGSNGDEYEQPNQGMTVDEEEDIKPVLEDLTIKPLPANSVGTSFALPIEMELDDDDLAELTSNDGEDTANGHVSRVDMPMEMDLGGAIDHKLQQAVRDMGNVAADVILDITPGNLIEAKTDELSEEAVEDVRVGVNEVAIGPSVPVSPSQSSAPSIEEIRQKDIPSSYAGPSKRSKRISDRLELESQGDKKIPSARALEAIRSSRQTRAKTNASRPVSISSSERSVSPNLQVVIPTRSRRLWRQLVETEGESDVEDLLDDENSAGALSSGPSNGFGLVESHELTIEKIFPLPPLIPDPPVPAGRLGRANRILDTRLIDDWNRRKPHLTNNPSLHRAVFEAYMAQCTSVDEPLADEIRVVNTVDGEGAPPDFEFQYSNDMLYNPEVPDPELGLGCDCDGPCDPNSKTCSCVKRQEAYFYDLGMKGFAYDELGRIKETSVSVWECGKTCGCPPECMNRVIQRGRGKYTQIELFKTKYKGWGIRAAAPIPAGTFLGIYAGELITEQESEERGYHYAKLGRTYLFDCDGWQIANPPAGLDAIDPRAAELAEAAAQRARQVALEADDPAWVYSAYSVDAFHYGFTRYFNHSCDPNLAITQAYVKDFHPERPMLVIFARRAVGAGEELCISYKGVPDDDEDVRPVVPSPKRRGKGKKNSKTSASAHVGLTGLAKSKVAAKDQCMCGAPRCDGRMFNYGD